MRIEKRGDLWCVVLYSPIAEDWIVVGEHETEEAAKKDLEAWKREP